MNEDSPLTIPTRTWVDRARHALNGFVLWWDSDAPDRRLPAEEAHDLANVILIAKSLLDVGPDLRDEDDGPPNPE